MKRLLSFAFIVCILFSPSLWADKEKPGYQFMIRTGHIEGRYTGTFDGEFEVDLALDISAEYFTHPDGSLLLRYIQALDSDSVPQYVYTGAGIRLYYLGRGAYYVQEDADIQLTSRPKLRAYVAAEFGFAQVVVKSFGDVLQSVSSMSEFGLNTGAIYQINDRFGLEVQVGGTLGYGISSTNANGDTKRALAGITYYF